MGRFNARQLKAAEVFARIANVNNGGVKVLLYKKAGVDQQILSEMFGDDGWGVTYNHTAGRIGERDVIISDCTVKVLTEKGWIEKSGSSDTLKAEASGNVRDVSSIDNDAMKRAGFLFGIGEELKTLECFIPKSYLFGYKAGTEESAPTCDDRILIDDMQVSEDKKLEFVKFRILPKTGYGKSNTFSCVQPEEEKKPESKPVNIPVKATPFVFDGELMEVPDSSNLESEIADFDKKEDERKEEEADAAMKVADEAPAEAAKPKYLMNMDTEFNFGYYTGKKYKDARNDKKFVIFAKYVAGNPSGKNTLKDYQIEQYQFVNDLGNLLKAGESLADAEKELGMTAA